MPEKLRADVRANIGLLVGKVNEALSGKNLSDIAPILRRIDSSGSLPHWFNRMQRYGALPNLDGKTVGSVIEKLAVCVMERYLLKDVRLSVNPARGVDVPELELGIKSPSTNYCTSEPFFSPYERILGNEYDALILLTNYQSVKRMRPLHLQIIDAEYLEGSQIADKNICNIARRLRAIYRDDIPILKKAVKFLAYVNQSDWEAKAIVELLSGELDERSIKAGVRKLEERFADNNKKAERFGREKLHPDVLKRLSGIAESSPCANALVMAADNWVSMEIGENAREPNGNEMQRFYRGKLDGRIGMSYALQWRYNFGGIFKRGQDD